MHVLISSMVFGCCVFNSYILGRSEREKFLGAEIHGLSATELLHYIDNNIRVDEEEDAEQLNEIVWRLSSK